MFKGNKQSNDGIGTGKDTNLLQTLLLSCGKLWSPTFWKEHIKKKLTISPLESG